MKQEETLHFKTRKEWREWLEKNHAVEKEAWLIHYKKHVDNSGFPQREAVEEAICFGWIDGKLRKINEERFILRFTPRKTNSVWSKINRDAAEDDQIREDDQGRSGKDRGREEKRRLAKSVHQPA